MSDALVTFGTLDYGAEANTLPVHNAAGRIVGFSCEDGQEARFAFACPKKKSGRCSGLLIAGRSDLKRDPQGKNGGVPMWDWDGNRNSPTFAPSINCEGCWHGYIENGRCVDTSKTDEPEPT